MRRSYVDQCMAFLYTMYNIVFDFEKDGFTIAAIVWLVAALSVPDQFKPFPIYNFMSEIIILLNESSFGKSPYSSPPPLLAPHLTI